MSGYLLVQWFVSAIYLDIMDRKVGVNILDQRLTVGIYYWEIVEFKELKGEVGVGSTRSEVGFFAKISGNWYM